MCPSARRHARPYRISGSRIVENVHKIKLWDKVSALEKMLKHLGGLVERHEITGKNGAPIQTKELSTIELARRKGI